MINTEDFHSDKNVSFDLIDNALIESLSKGEIFELFGIGTFQIKDYSGRKTVAFKQISSVVSEDIAFSKVLLKSKEMYLVLEEKGELILKTGVFNASVLDNGLLKITYAPSRLLREMILTNKFVPIEEEVEQKPTQEFTSEEYNNISGEEESDENIIDDENVLIITDPICEQEGDIVTDLEEEDAEAFVPKQEIVSKQESIPVSFWGNSDEKKSSTNDTMSQIPHSQQKGCQVEIEEPVFEEEKKGRTIKLIGWIFVVVLFFGVVAIEYFVQYSPSLISEEKLAFTPIGDGLAFIGILLAAYVFFKKKAKQKYS